MSDDGRRISRRVAAAALVGAASGLAAWGFHDSKQPIRARRRQVDRTIPDHRVQPGPTVPKLVVVRGKDPAKNLTAALTRLGGLAPFIKKGETVLLKPNVGWDRRPEQAANTNPQVIAELVRHCREAGAGRVLVCDNPVNDAQRCFTHSGILEAARQAGAEVILPEKTRYHFVVIPGKLGRWPVLEPFITADKVINVPATKHHSLTRATLGMKNWYGILGGRRNQLHQRIEDSVVELTALMRPTLTVMDATRLLVRNGPTGGSLADVKPGEALAVSVDPIAIDSWASTLLDLDPRTLPWLRLGQEHGLGTVDYRSLSPIEITAG
jgi:uncharacterized protein (DUF362 family)